MMASLFALAETFPDLSTVTHRQATTWHSSQSPNDRILQQPARSAGAYGPTCGNV
jgi:hypothetical protein